MPLYTVELRTGLYEKGFAGVVEVPSGTSDINDFIRKNAGVTVANPLVINKCDFEPGQFYPRMARPQLINNSYIGVAPKGPLYLYEENMAAMLPHDKSSLANSVNQLSILIEELKEIMRYVQPDKSNLNCYGHHTRNVLLLACMEFENECKGVLRAHSYSASNNYYSTNDFVKLLKPLRLSEYTIRLSYYPDLDPVSPFTGWNSAAPTQSITWYDNYNATKHDREISFSKADLLSGITAVCSLAIILAAQYRTIDIWRDQIGEFFHFQRHPEWSCWQNYLLPAPGNSWQALQYTF
jgi:hypothetical protein